jgi:CheY-like chemotaxis protein
LGRIRNALFPGDLEFRAQIFAVLAVVLLVYSKRGGRYRLCYGITIAAVFISLFPIMFFSAGGYYSGMPGFFVFAVVFTMFMERTELRVDTVSGGAECLEAVQRERYHAILMDYMMSGMDGIETWRHLRALAAGKAAAGTLQAKNSRLRGTGCRYGGTRGLLEQGLRYFSADTGQYRKTAAMFLRNYPERTKELRELLEKQDWAGLRFRVHPLKSNAKATGARNLSEIAARMEAYYSEGRGVLVESAAALLFAEWGEMKQAPELFADESG